MIKSLKANSISATLVFKNRRHAETFYWKVLPRLSSKSTKTMTDTTVSFDCERDRKVFLKVDAAVTLLLEHQVAEATHLERYIVRRG